MRERSQVYHSRLDGDPVAMGKAVFLACVISVLTTYFLFPPSSRRQSLEEIALRFGFPGPTRYEREIRVQLSDQSPTVLVPNRLMGGLRRTEDPARAGAPVPASRRAGRTGPRRQEPGLAGFAESGLESSRRLRHLNLPTVQSEDLIIVELVRPQYPREAVEQGLTGRIELLALVNERGTVDDVEFVHGAGPLLDEAAERAVRSCRFLPYRKDGRVQAVYADFRFNFTLLGD